MIKEILPYQLKISINLIRNQIIDLFKGVKYASKNNIKIDYIGDIEITQEIKSKNTNAKIKNINNSIKKNFLSGFLIIKNADKNTPVITKIEL